MSDDALERMARVATDALRQGRDLGLDAAIELCEEFAKTGHSAECCVHALRDLKASLNDIAPAPKDRH